MDWNEIFKIIFSVIASGGVVGLIITILGKRWLESIKKEHQKEIEAFKATTLRYSGQQFELYSKLWHSLHGLKLTADKLWERANEENLLGFSLQLKKTSDEVEKSYLFIEDSHYKSLSGLLNGFRDYEIGKKKLIQLRKHDVNASEVRQVVESNHRRKEEYGQLIIEIRNDLRKQLRGN